MQRRDVLKAGVATLLFPMNAIAGRWTPAVHKNHKWAYSIDQLNADTGSLGEAVEEANASLLQTALTMSDNKELVMFSPEWCVNCKTLKKELTPWLEDAGWSIGKQYHEDADLIIVRSEKFAELHGVKDFPSFGLFEKGKMTDFYRGQNHNAIARMVVPNYDPWRNYSPSWTNPGSIEVHLVSGHGMSQREVDRMTEGECYHRHDEIHEAAGLSSPQKKRGGVFREFFARRRG